MNLNCLTYNKIQMINAMFFLSFRKSTVNFMINNYICKNVFGLLKHFFYFVILSKQIKR